MGSHAARLDNTNGKELTRDFWSATEIRTAGSDVAADFSTVCRLVENFCDFAKLLGTCWASRVAVGFWTVVRAAKARVQFRKI